MKIQWTLPLRLVNALNSREHWRTENKRAGEQRGLACAQTRSRIPKKFSHPYRVTITRTGPKALDDDGLAASAKHVRDGISDALSVNDGDTKKIRFKYRQELCSDWTVRVVIEEVR